MGLANKTDALLSLAPDVAVISECSEKSTLELRERGYRTLWFGANPHKGLGVVCRKEWTIRAIQPPDQRWVVPIQVKAPVPFTLIAVWACQIGARKQDNYIGQVYQALMSHPEWFSHGPVVLAGDLNSNKIWDSERTVGNHSDVVKQLAECGLVSVYHEYFREPQGEERQPTIYLYRHKTRPFHIDYIFLPKKWMARIQTVAVGKFAKWSKLSDHCPIVVELQD